MKEKEFALTQETLESYARFLRKEGYKVLYVGLYGSQNYNLHDSKSDVDAFAVVALSPRQLLEKTSVNKDFTFMDGAKLTVKDFMSTVKNVMKGNTTALEPFQTDYWVGDRQVRELFNTANVNLAAVAGTADQKLKNCFNKVRKENAEYGYNPKDLQHFCRLVDLFSKLKNGLIKVLICSLVEIESCLWK